MKTHTRFLLQATGSLILIMSLLAGCAKKDDSSASTPQYNWGSCASCAGIIGNGIPGLTGIRSSTSSGSALFAFDLIVSQNGMVNWNDPKAILAYAGPATMQGVIRVLQNGDYSFCGIPAGDYQVRPMTSSTVSMGGVVSGGTFEMIGPARLMFSLGQSTIYNSQDPNGVYNGSRTNRIGFNLMISGCGPLVTY